jgi:hypothetical protein
VGKLHDAAAAQGSDHREGEIIMKVTCGTLIGLLVVFGGMGIFGAKYAPSVGGVVVWAFPLAVPILLFAVVLWATIHTLLEGKLLYALGALIGGTLGMFLIYTLMCIPYSLVHEAYQYQVIKQKTCPEILEALPRGELLCRPGSYSSPFLYHFNPPGWENL